MRKTLVFLTVVLLAMVVVGSAAAADLQGFLVDRHCSAKVVKEGQKAAQSHTRECALMPDCVASGYGVLTPEGKFITLDSAGNKMAEAALKASQKKNELRVQLSGQVSGDSIKVANLKLL